MATVNPVPDYPNNSSSSTSNGGTRAADPDLILFDTELLPIDLMTDLLFEQVGGQEIINISRHDLVNGQNVSYRLISNTTALEQQANPKNIFRLSGTLSEYFENFAIKLAPHIPEEGTGPSPYYVGGLNSNPGCAGYPVLDRYDDTLIGCYTTFSEAQTAIDKDLAPFRPIVYSDTENGNIVIDVTKMKSNELVDIEILQSGTVENDTIY